VFVVVLLIMAGTTRLYYVRLMKINGPDTFGDSCSYLLDDEKDAVADESAMEHGRMSLHNIKQTIEDLRKVDERRLLKAQNGASTTAREMKRMLQNKSNALNKTKTMVFLRGGSDNNAKNVKVKATGLATGGITGVARKFNVRPPASIEASPEPLGQPLPSVPRSPPAQPVAPLVEPVHEVTIKSRKTTISGLTGSLLNVVSRRKSSEEPNRTAKMRIVFISYTGIQSGLYLFNSAGLYFGTRDVCNLMLCLTYAFYCTTIAIVSTNTHSPFAWNSIFVFLLVLTVVVQKYVIHASSVINAMSAFNADVVGRVIEEQVSLDMQDKLSTLYIIIIYLLLFIIIILLLMQF
jgi:hypothetical protein